MNSVKIKNRLNTTSGMIAVTSLSNLIGSILNIVAGLIVAKLLLPEELGLFNSFSIFTGYIILLQIGIPSGLSRELPFFFGKGEIEKAHKFASTAQFFSLSISILILVISIVVAGYFYYLSSIDYAFGSIIIGITSFRAFYVTKYLKILYRSNTDFNKLATIDFIFAVISLLSVVFIWLYGFYGLGIRVFLTVLVELIISFYWRPIRIKPEWSLVRFKELFKIGGSMFFVSSIYGLWPTIQRTVILSLGGVKALGLFALAFIVQSMLGIVSSSISNISFPKMSYAYGKGASFKEILNIPLTFVLYAIVLHIIVAIIGWFLLPIVVEMFLPNYIEGTEAAQWMLIVSLVSVLVIFSNIYMVINRNTDRLKSNVLGMLVWFIAVYVQYKWYGFDLIIFPISLVIGYLSSFIIDGYFFNKYYINSLNNIKVKK